MLALRSNGFFTATFSCNPFSRSLWETVDLEICLFSGKLFHLSIKSLAVLFLSLRLFKHRSYSSIRKFFWPPISFSCFEVSSFFYFIKECILQYLGNFLSSTAIFLSVHPTSFKAFFLILWVAHINGLVGMCFGKT